MNFTWAFHPHPPNEESFRNLCKISVIPGLFWSLRKNRTPNLLPHTHPCSRFRMTHIWRMLGEKNLPKFKIAIWLTYMPMILMSQTHYISGYVEDGQSGERMIGARIFTANETQKTISNTEGFFSLNSSLHSDRILITVYPGYQSDSTLVSIDSQFPLVISLFPLINLDSVDIVAPISKVGQLSLNMDKIKALPAMIGEVDALRTFQLLPGVAGGNEGTSALYVRGGSPDQNLVLLDDVPLYYVNHIGGFLSIFDPNTIKQMNLIKGGFPAKYGGRLSSVIEVYTKDGNEKQLMGNYRLGMLAGGITLEGPLGKSKNTTFLFSARRSFVDAFTRIVSQMSSTEDFQAGYIFYDVNGKLTHRPTDKDVISFSVYQGSDRLFANWNDNEVESPISDLDFKFNARTNIKWGNTLVAFRWQHLFGKNTMGKFISGFTRFRYLTDFEGPSNRHTVGYGTGLFSKEFSVGY